MSSILFPEQVEYLQSFLKTNDPLLIEMELFAEEKKIPILDKFSSQFLEQLLLIYNPKKVLEIGSAIGYSTIRVSKMLQKEGQIDTIELSQENLELFEQFIVKYGEGDNIHLIKGDALEIIPNLEDNYDFVFLDSDKEDYEKLFKMVIQKIKIGGVILVDNLLWKGFAASKSIPENYKISTESVRKFNEIFMNFPGLNAFILPIGDGLGLGIKTD